MINSLKIFLTRLRTWINGDSWEYPVDFYFEELDNDSSLNDDFQEKLKNRKERPILKVQRFPPYD